MLTLNYTQFKLLTIGLIFLYIPIALNNPFFFGNWVEKGIRCNITTDLAVNECVEKW